MVSLGQASNYSFRRTIRHLLAWGTAKDSQKLCQALAERYIADPTDVELYHSGRSAIAAGLLALNRPTKTVIIPGLTCIAVVRAVRFAKMQPIFCDIERNNLAYDYKKLEKLAKAHPGGVILVQNTLGITWDIEKITQIAQKYDQKILEDLAHSAGRFYPDGHEVGTVGDIVALSFGKGKAIDTICGGAAILRGRQLSRRHLLPHPSEKPGLSTRLRDRWYPVFGGISRLTWRFGFGKLFMSLLTKIHFVERSADTKLNLDQRLTHWQSKLALSQLSCLPRGVLREFMLVEDRTNLLRELSASGYNFSEIWYDTPVSPARYADEAAFPERDCPNTVDISAHIINLPTWYPAEKITYARQIIEEYRHER